MIKARSFNINSMTVWGFDEKAPKRAIMTAAKAYAKELQSLLAKLYSNEKVVGGKLIANDKAYTAWKRKNGFSTKRGQLTGHTLEVLESGKIMEIRFRGKGKKRKVTIVVMRTRFYRLVGDYIQHYEDLKVPNETITAFKTGWARNARKHFKKVEG